MARTRSMATLTSLINRIESIDTEKLVTEAWNETQHHIVEIKVAHPDWDEEQVKTEFNSKYFKPVYFKKFKEASGL